MAGLVNYGSSDEDDNIHEEVPQNIVDVSQTIITLNPEQIANSADIRRANLQYHQVRLRMASYLVCGHENLFH